MFDIFTRSHFSAAHHLREYPGNCEKPHGHNWKIEVTIRASKLDDLGMAVDFRVVKNAVNKIMESLDHCDLNEHPGFTEKNPSSENIAVYIFNELKLIFADRSYSPHRVTVRETDNCGVTYSEE